MRISDTTETQDHTNTLASIDCNRGEKPEEKVKLQVIRQLMDSGKLYAALANLDAIAVHSPQETYLRAEILRQTGRSEVAIPLYKQLTKGCAAGYAYHGLGLISGKSGNINEALDFLSQARMKLPTNIDVRNDLGYAMFLSGQYEPARHEFLTALELDEKNEFSASNLVLLLLVTDQYDKAQSLAVRKKISGATFKELVAKATEIREATELQKPGADRSEQATAMKKTNTK